MTQNYAKVRWMMVGLAAMMAGAASAENMAATAPPRVPDNLRVPAGNTAYLKAHAVGTQNYVCLPSSPGGPLAWKFQGPQATLFLPVRWINGEIRQQIATHYLSPNPGEAGMPARATWQSSIDTSAVWAKKTAESADPAYVAPGAIPWFLLATAGTQRGPAGGSILAHTTYIQRVNTTGGIMPATACVEAGALQFVPYTADYVFYRAGGGGR